LFRFCLFVSFKEILAELRYIHTLYVQRSYNYAPPLPNDAEHRVEIRKHFAFVYNFLFEPRKEEREQCLPRFIFAFLVGVLLEQSCGLWQERVEKSDENNKNASLNSLKNIIECFFAKMDVY
jgi:hypothetical protein